MGKEMPEFIEEKNINEHKVETCADIPIEGGGVQKLILPFNGRSTVYCGWKASGYTKKTGKVMYGQTIKGPTRIDGDFGSTSWSYNQPVYASGAGVVKKIYNSRSTNGPGKVICIVYENVWNHTKKKGYSVAARYFYMQEISSSLSVGKRVSAGTYLGKAGSNSNSNMGDITGGALHIEFDTDTTYVDYSPTVTKLSDGIYPGYDTTIDPCELFHIGSGQSIDKTTVSGWVYSNDVNLPTR